MMSWGRENRKPPNYTYQFSRVIRQSKVDPHTQIGCLAALKEMQLFEPEQMHTLDVHFGLLRFKLKCIDLASVLLKMY